MQVINGVSWHKTSDGGLYRRENGRYISYHRQIMEEKLGRKLTSDEEVRFKDGDRTNFSPDNLILGSRKARARAQLAELPPGSNAGHPHRFSKPRHV